MLFFLHIKIENQLLTDCTHLQNELTYHNQLQYYAQRIVHISTAEINTFRNVVIVSVFLS